MTAMRKTPFPSQISAAAYHEAGHAVMCRLMRFRLRSISVGNDELAAGQTTHDIARHRTREGVGETDAVRRRVEKTILVCLAGPLAQARYDGENPKASNGGAVDVDTAFDLALRLFRSKRTATAFLKFAEEWARQKLDEPSTWAAVEALAGALLREGRLSGSQARAIIREASYGPMANPKKR